MANIVRSGQAAPATTTPSFEPFRLMRELFGWDPFREMTSFAPLGAPAAFNPDFEIKETKEGFVFKADVPGIKEQDIEIAMTGNRLTVSGKREAEKQEKTETYYAYERSYGSFARAFTLPDGVDAEKVKAELKDGVLTIFAPKKPETQPKKIAVAAEKK
jgi:HSP20 family protein